MICKEVYTVSERNKSFPLSLHRSGPRRKLKQTEIPVLDEFTSTQSFPKKLCLIGQWLHYSCWVPVFICGDRLSPV